MLLKKKINKDKLPSVKTSKINKSTQYFFSLLSYLDTVTENIGSVVNILHLSKDYETSKTSDGQAVLKAKIGPVYLILLASLIL